MRVKTRELFATAIQFDHDKMDDLEEFLGHPIFDLFTETNHIDNTTKYYFKLCTLDGKVKVIEGDWIIRYDNDTIIVRSDEQFKFLFNKVR